MHSNRTWLFKLARQLGGEKLSIRRRVREALVFGVVYALINYGFAYINLLGFKHAAKLTFSKMVALQAVVYVVVLVAYLSATRTLQYLYNPPPQILEAMRKHVCIFVTGENAYVNQRLQQVLRTRVVCSPTFTFYSDDPACRVLVYDWLVYEDTRTKERFAKWEEQIRNYKSWQDPEKDTKQIVEELDAYHERMRVLLKFVEDATHICLPKGRDELRVQLIQELWNACEPKLEIKNTN